MGSKSPTNTCMPSLEHPLFRSSHANKVDAALNETRRLITGCLKPTPVSLVLVLTGIAPLDVRKNVASDIQRSVQVNDKRHPLYGHQPVLTRLKSRKSFLKSTTELTTSAEHGRHRRWVALVQTNNFKIRPMEQLPPGYSDEWSIWNTLNR